MADRYGDIPLVGIEIAVVWTLYHWAMSWQIPRIVVATASMTIIGVLGVLAFVQTSHWQNSKTLFESILHSRSGQCRGPQWAGCHRTPK